MKSEFKEVAMKALEQIRGCGYTAKEISARVGVPLSTVQSWTKREGAPGKRFPRGDMVKRLVEWAESLPKQQTFDFKEKNEK